MSEYASSQIWMNFASKTALLLGVAQIVIGVFCIIFQTVVIIAASPSAKMVQGLWGGVFFIVTGAFGVNASKQRTTCSIVTLMVLSILAAALFGTLVLVLSMLGLFVDTFPFGGRHAKKYAVYMDVLLMILSLIEIIVAIASSANCCAAVCCRSPPQSETVKREMEMGHVVAAAAPRPYGQPSHQAGDGAASVSQFAEHEKLFAA